MSSANTSRQIELEISADNLTEALFSSPTFSIFMMGKRNSDWQLTVKGYNGLIPLVLTERKRKKEKVKKGVRFKVYGKRS